MPNKLPPEIIKHWPEVFSHVEVKAVPLEYLESILVHFDDGTSYEITLDHEEIESYDVASDVEDEIETFLAEYEDTIDGIEFKLDTKKVIRDVKARTKTFLKKNK